MFVFIALAAIILLCGFFKSIFTKPYDEGSIKDIYKFKRDVRDPHISSRQLDKNIREGKYR